MREDGNDDGSSSKMPYLVLFWADDRRLLTYGEQRDVESTAVRVVSFTPGEVLLELPDGRKVVVRGVLDPGAPPPPRRKL